MISGEDVFLAIAITTLLMLVLALGLAIFAGLDMWLDKAISKKIKKLLGAEG